LIVGTGIDVIEITRVERALRRSGEKEAVMKALGTGWADGVRWVDIETVSESSKSPDRLALRLHGRVAELAAERNAHPHLAVSCTRSHAVAFVLFENSDR
jgi:holo-[acyl-carrier protein] synthase